MFVERNISPPIYMKINRMVVFYQTSFIMILLVITMTLINGYLLPLLTLRHQIGLTHVNIYT